jgi:hypothetical protein
MEFLSSELVAIVPLAVGLVEVPKRVGVPTKYAPVTAVLSSVGLA